MKETFNTIGIISKFSDVTIGGTVATLVNFLLERDLKVILDSSAAKTLPPSDLETVDTHQLGDLCDLAIVAGGASWYLGNRPAATVRTGTESASGGAEDRHRQVVGLRR